MTTLTSALNYGALITLSCCNAVLQIAAAPACPEPAQDSNWPACAPDGARGENRPAGQAVPSGRRHADGSEPECGTFELLRGKLCLVEAEGRRKPVDSLEWRPH